MKCEYRDAKYASLLSSPVGEIVIPSHDLVTAMLGAGAVNHVEIDVCDKKQQLCETVDGYAYIGMNTAGKLENGPLKDGVIFTNSLAGCTGIAGFAHHEDGRTFQFVGHFTPAAERTIINQNYWEPLHAIGTSKYIRTPDPRYTVPTPHNMADFYDWASKEGASSVQMLIAYGGRDHPYEYFDVRHYFTDFNEAVNRRTKIDEPVKQAVLLPYDGGNNNLAAGRINGQEGIFWNGVRVDFDGIYSAPSISVLTQ